jgi:hypothetical protein
MEKEDDGQDHVYNRKNELDARPGRHYACKRGCVSHDRGAPFVKLAGFVLLLSGWLIVLAAIALLAQAAARSGFVVAGMGVEGLGLVVAVRSHRVARGHRG